MLRITRTLSLSAIAVFLAFLAAVLPRTAVAQADPVAQAVRAADWDTSIVAPGVQLRQVRFPHLLGLPQFVNVLEADLNADGVLIDVVQPDSGRMLTSKLALAHGAVAAVNGSFFEADGTPSIFFQDNGQVIREDDDERIRFVEDGAVATTTNGDATVVRRSLAEWQLFASFADVLVTGPLLVWDGELTDQDVIGFNLTHHPRTAAGITSDNRLLLVTADGRNSQAAGFTMQELALLMRALGSIYAVNLDGGGSTTMWIRDSGVVNHPSDNGAFDASGERAVANAVIVRLGQ